MRKREKKERIRREKGGRWRRVKERITNEKLEKKIYKKKKTFNINYIPIRMHDIYTFMNIFKTISKISSTLTELNEV